MNPRLAAAEALVKSMRSGELSASVALGACLAQDVVLDTNGPMPGAPTDRIPAGAIPLINNARVNETPFLVAHTDENGDPVLTFRGSIQVWSDTELCAWIRQAGGGLVRSMAKNPKVSLAYRDGPRAMLLINGRARIETDEAIRKRVFDLTPEVEQNHDPMRKGAAMIIEVDRMMGFTTGGEPVRMERKKA